jgi:hypothetical protein
VFVQESRVDADPPDSSGTEHTPDTSDTSLKQPYPELKCNNEKEKKKQSKDQSKSSGSGSKNVKETISRLLRK